MARTNYWFYERGEGDPDPAPLTMKSLMVSNPAALRPTDLVMDAIKLFKEREIRHVPIVGDERKVVGMLTETDILRNVLHGRTMTRDEEYHATMDMLLPIGEVMVREVATLPPDAKVAEAVEIFLKRKVRCIPIVDGDRALVGIVTETDLLHLFQHMISD